MPATYGSILSRQARQVGDFRDDDDEEEEDVEDRRTTVARAFSTVSVDQHTTVTGSDWRSWVFPSKDWHYTGRLGISPRNNLVQWLDRLVVLTLFLTATATVLIVCILMTRPVDKHGSVEESRVDFESFRFVYDYPMDVILALDFVLGFYRAFRKEGGRGRMVFDLDEIQRLNLRRGDFFFDLIASIPFDIMVLIGLMFGYSATNLRFLRLLKLLKLPRAYQIINESLWYQKFSLEVDSRKLHMAQLVFGLIMVEHWAACWWVWLGREEILLQRNRYTWIDLLQENGFIFNRNSEVELYIVGLYWASTVSSSVGSGDIIPANPQEAMFVALFQILGGCLFAYAVSSLVGLYAALYANDDGRGAAIDAVNEMLLELQRESADVDIEKIRSFVYQACDARAARARRRLAPGGALAQLSPQLRDEVFLAERQPWINKIWYLRDCRPRLASALARDAKWVTYAPGDFVTLSPDQAIIITRGAASTADHVLVRGSRYGIEGLATVSKPALKLKGPSMLCLNFVEGLMLESTSVEKNIRKEGDQWEIKRFLRARVRYGLLHWARMQKKAQNQEKANKVSPVSSPADF